MAPPRLTREQLQESIDALLLHGGNQTRAADAMGMSRGAYQVRLAIARREGLDFSAVDELRRPRLVLKGQSILYDRDGNEKGRWDKTRQEGRDPETVEHLPDPKKITKISTLYDQQGKVTQQWIAEKPEDAQREALWMAFAEGLAKKIERAKPIKAPARTSADLLAVYPVGDHHTGMLAWPAETGAEAYDLAIAERLLREASIRLIDSCPPCDQALIPFLGDFFHYDSYAAVTPQHKNLLDADGRYPKMVEVGVRIIRHVITAALERHKRVTVIFEGGNHDPSTSACVRILLACLYENEPRVKIDTSPMAFHYFEFGKNLLGTHHGDRAKMDKLPGIMAHDRPEAWGRTDHRVWFTGHVHHDSKKSYPGCKVESFEVLAPPDAYGAGEGYRSPRSMKAIVFHRERGEVERHTVTPDMLKVAA